MDGLSFLLENVLNVIGGSPGSWVLALAVLCALGLAAGIDAATGRVPDTLVGFGVVVAFFGLYFIEGPAFALERLLLGVGATFFLWGFNEIYYRLRRQDGFGFGDAKWTGLAVLGFGPRPVIAAWIVGAWIALLWLAGRWAIGKLQAQAEKPPFAVRFAPFLFFGLLIGIAAG